MADKNIIGINVANDNKKKVNFNTASNNDYLTNEAYKSLRTNLLFCSENAKVILVTSTVENEGKSTVSAELAKSLAELGKKTLLVDADMRKSVLLKNNPRSAEIVGLSDILSGLIPSEETIYNTQNPNFDVVFSGRFPPNPVELFENGRFKDFLDGLRETYDFIIIDSPPLGVVIDAAVIASYADGAVLVFAERRTGRKAALETKEQIEKSGCRVLGGIINEADQHNSKYYKKYYKYRGYHYSKYYKSGYYKSGYGKQ